MNPIGCNSKQLSDIMSFCGYEELNLTDDKKLYFFKQRKKQTNKNKTKNTKKIIGKKQNKLTAKADPNSPFAVLEKLL